MIPLSILDLSVVTTATKPAAALRNSIDLARHADRLSAAERAALLTHLARLEDGANFVSMVDSIKARDFVSLARSAWRRPRAVRHFAMPIRARIERLARRGAGVGVST